MKPALLCRFATSRFAEFKANLRFSRVDLWPSWLRATGLIERTVDAVPAPVQAVSFTRPVIWLPVLRLMLAFTLK